MTTENYAAPHPQEYRDPRYEGALREIDNLSAVIRRRNETIAEQQEWIARLEGLDDVRRETVPNEALRDLQALVGKINEEKGFHDEGSRLFRHTLVAYEPDKADEADAALRNYYVAKLALITAEAAEAIEELRFGRAVHETYYSGGYQGALGLGSDEAVDLDGKPRKPEGVPSELADIVIRALDFAYEAGIDLAEIIDEKLRYNETRGHRHGKQF